MAEPHRLILSRKGFDSAAGGGPSPIVDGRPVSLPIPGEAFEGAPTYGELKLGHHALAASRDNFGPDHAAHHDPFFDEAGQCAFGQSDAAQSHLINQGVGVGDCFLFFGLFAGAAGHRHHRIFGYLIIDRILCPMRDAPPAFAPRHPHFFGNLKNRTRNAVYIGKGRTAATAPAQLRLSASGEGGPSLWHVPGWLYAARRLSYHNAPSRWRPGGLLQSVGRGQEFVTEIAGNQAAQDWLRATIALIEEP